jgi:hypothetical protein
VKPPKVGLDRSKTGRAKGTPNKTTALLKDAIIKAAEAVGEDGKGKGDLMGYCKFLATAEPKAFAGLLGKVLPMQITGDGDGAVVVEIRRYADQSAK